MFITRHGNTKWHPSESPGVPDIFLIVIIYSCWDSYCFLCLLVFWCEDPQMTKHLAIALVEPFLCPLVDISSGNHLKSGALVQQSITLKRWEHKFPKWVNVCELWWQRPFLRLGFHTCVFYLLESEHTVPHCDLACTIYLIFKTSILTLQGILKLLRL